MRQAAIIAKEFAVPVAVVVLVILLGVSVVR
jgi:hypothetical protein